MRLDEGVAIDPGSSRVVAAIKGGEVVLDQSAEAVSASPQSRTMAPWPGLPAWSEAQARQRQATNLPSVESLDPGAMAAVVHSVLGELGARRRPVAIVVPIGLTPSARTALQAAVLAIGAVGGVTLVEAPTAAALSLDPSELDRGFLVGEIGASRTQAAFARPALSSTGEPVSERVVAQGAHAVGSRDLESAIREWLEANHQLEVSDATASRILREVGSAWPATDFAVEIAGRSPGRVVATATLAPEELRLALELRVDTMVDILRRTFHHRRDDGMKPERIFLSGGGSQLNGLAERVAHELGVATSVVDYPHTAAARGAASLL